VRQPDVKEPVLHRERWVADDIASAFDVVLREHLEPFGLEKRVPVHRLGTSSPRTPTVAAGR